MPPLPIPNKLMPWLQAIIALIIVVLFCIVCVGPMVGWKPADVDMKETLKAIMFILTGFLFGSAVSSAKKDDQNAALVAQVLPQQQLGNGVKVDDSTPIAVKETP